MSSRLFLPREHLRHSAYSESKVIPGAGSQQCQFKSSWESWEISCHETTAAAKPYPFRLLSQPVTQAAGTGHCWDVQFPGVGKQHPCCCCCSLVSIWQMLVPISFIPLSLFGSWARPDLSQCCWHCPGPGSTWGTTPWSKGIPCR